MAWFRTSFLALVVACCFPLAYAQQSGASKSEPAKSEPAKAEPALDVTAMDTSVDPCVDFFAYSCGGWIKRNPIPPDQSSWDTYSKMQDENRFKLRDILEAAAAPAANRNAVTQKIGDYYASCMDEKAIDSKGAEPLRPTLDKIAALQSKADLADVTAGMIDDGVLFEF